MPEDSMKYQRYEFNTDVNPQLNWIKKNERTSFEVPTVSLTQHEKIEPKTIMTKLLQDKRSASLGRFIDIETTDNRIEDYRYENDWSNRLIQGDSLLVMNSLLQKEGMGNKIQMIYIDPPYGIEYNSNFQLEHSSCVDENDCSDVGDDANEPEQIRAFRDTWELGIHSYLSYLRERLLLSKLLLKEEGSIFIQINDDNLANVFQLMQEIFGASNFVAIIPFKKTSSKPTKLMPSVCDYLVWFGKNKTKMKYHPMFKLKEINKETLKTYTNVELKDGTRRALTLEEKQTGIIPEDARLFMTAPLHSQGYSKSRSVPYEFNGKQFTVPKNRSWSISQEGLLRLGEMNRVYETDNNLRFVSYFDDYPISRITNFWENVFNEPDQIYVVQTSTKVVQRCIIMTTDPSDIVMDPTCGSGTTAWVAEQWGRRWITCDTSRVAINIAKKRLLTSFFDYYKLDSEKETMDFIYKKYPHISASTIAYNKEINYEIMYDEIEIDTKRIRVSGPFALENITISENLTKKENNKTFNDKIISYLELDGLSYPLGKKVNLVNIEPYSGEILSAQAGFKFDTSKRVAIFIGPEFGFVTSRCVEQAIDEAINGNFDYLFIIGFMFDELSRSKIIKNRTTELGIELVLINPDIMIGDLHKETTGAQIFTVFGEPKLKVVKNDKDEYQIEIISLEFYEPETGELNVVGDITNKISAWFIDEDFDGKTFFVCQAIFPNDKKYKKNLRRKLGKMLDDSKIKRVTGNKSAPFKSGEFKRAVVKVFDLRGNESVLFVDLNQVV
jgi:adenine-specific DNA-methyltransferase